MEPTELEKIKRVLPEIKPLPRWRQMFHQHGRWSVGEWSESKFGVVFLRRSYRQCTICGHVEIF